MTQGPQGDSLTTMAPFMSAMSGAQQGVSAAITSAFSVVSPAQLSSFATAIGPIGVANMIPAFFEATGNNVTGGMLTAANHSMLGASTQAAQAGYSKVDEATGAGGNGGAQAGNPAPGDFPPNNAAPVDGSGSPDPSGVTL